MESWMWIAIAAGAVVLVALTISLLQTRSHHRSDRLRETFGPEYDRTVKARGHRKGEADLEEREKVAGSVQIRPLSAQEARMYEASWAGVQAHFIDSPSEAAVQADRLMTEILYARGYPVMDFDQTAGLVSTRHPRLAIRYRNAHSIAMRDLRHEATTEDLRQAMVDYRAAFNELVEVGGELLPEERVRPLEAISS
jgi:hypothetical protein